LGIWTTSSDRSICYTTLQRTARAKVGKSF
jgi:hypothetical protein